MSSRIMNLKDCVLSIIDCRGKTPKKLGSNWTAEGIRVISANNVHDGVLTDENEIRCVDDITYDKWMKEPVQKGDCFLVSEGATLGESLYWDSDEKIVLGQRLYAIRTKKDILDSKYFSLYLRSNICRKAISAISTGSTVFGISQKDLLELEIVVPDIYIQKEIGQLKYEIDKKIQNNNRINLELESMAKTIYDYWFLQFDFPDENGKPYKSSGGKMVWNEELKREIPAGWEKGVFSDLIDIGNGRDHKDLSDGNIPVYGSGGVMRTVDTSIYSGESVLIPRKGTLNNIIYVNSNFWTVDTMFYTKMKKKHSAIYTYYSAKLYDFEKLNTGTGVPSMTSSIIYNLKVVIPPDKILGYFDDYVQAFYRKMQENEMENRELVSLRDFLLPLLMNGQVGFKQ